MYASEGDHVYGALILLVDGREMAVGRENRANEGQQIVITINLHLQAGQLVQVGTSCENCWNHEWLYGGAESGTQYPPFAHYYGAHYVTWFTGYLVAPGTTLF